MKNRGIRYSFRILVILIAIGSFATAFAAHPDKAFLFVRTQFNSLESALSSGQSDVQKRIHARAALAELEAIWKINGGQPRWAGNQISKTRRLVDENRFEEANAILESVKTRGGVE